MTLQNSLDAAPSTPPAEGMSLGKKECRSYDTKKRALRWKNGCSLKMGGLGICLHRNEAVVFEWIGIPVLALC